MVSGYAYSSNTGRVYVFDGYVDADGDGYAATVDCADNDDAIHPAAIEVCDAGNTDEDCDGLADDDDPSAASDGKSDVYPDEDGDGYGGPLVVSRCDLPAGYVVDNTDCDDGDLAVNPGASEVCDADDTDEDCNGLADDFDPNAAGAAAYYADADLDGYTDPDSAAVACSPPPGFAAPTEADDCDDADNTVHPGANDPPGDGVDQDCDGADSTQPADTAAPARSKACGCMASPRSVSWVVVSGALALLLRRRRG
ncbi:hypothetical protein LBMAG42_47440 [Deltaproteobacteria bacterium]|nr:hypothetical protein LBMAG42_47440 [Deltaproteobacteria bacterium]